MKLCRWTLFEAGRALFMKNWKMFEENKQGLDGQSCTSTHFVAFEEHVADKCLAKPSPSLLLTALYSLQFSAFLYMRINLTRFSNGKHFRTKKLFISEWYLTKNHHLGVLIVRKVKKSWDSRQNRGELGPASAAWKSNSNCWSFRHVYRLDESKSFKSS